MSLSVSSVSSTPAPCSEISATPLSIWKRTRSRAWRARPRAPAMAKALPATTTPSRTR